MTRRCPECARPLEYGEEIVAAHVDGRIRELHRACLPARDTTEEPERSATVGERMRVILEDEGDDEPGLARPTRESAPTTAPYRKELIRE
jgi:hypothetical protein